MRKLIFLISQYKRKTKKRQNKNLEGATKGLDPWEIFKILILKSQGLPPFNGERFEETKVPTALQIVLTLIGPWGIGRGETKTVFHTFTLSWSTDLEATYLIQRRITFYI